MKTRSAKNKGQLLQKKLGQALSEATGLSFGKDQDISSRESGQTGIDIALSPKAIEIIPISWECKNWAKLNIHSAITQAKQNQKPGTIWACCVSQTGQKVKQKIKPIIILDEEHFAELLNKINYDENLITEFFVTKNSINLYNAISNCKKATKKGNQWVIIFTRTAGSKNEQQNPIVFLQFEFFMELVSKAMELYNKIPLGEDTKCHSKLVKNLLLT